MTTWQKFAADLFAEITREAVPVDPTSEPIKFCRDSWIRSKAFQFAEKVDTADQPN